MVCRYAFDSVTTASSLRDRDCAGLNANHMIRSTPARIIIDGWMSQDHKNDAPRCGRSRISTQPTATFTPFAPMLPSVQA